MVEHARENVYESIETFMERRLVSPGYKLLLVAEENWLGNATHYVEEVEET